MLLKNKCLIVFASILVFGCANNSEDDVQVDCDASDLSLTVSDFQKSDCNTPGSIEVSATGGDEPYTYSIDGFAFQENNTFSNLFAGNFNLQVKDATGCIAEVTFNLESEPSGIELTLSSEESDCLTPTGSIIANASGGIGTLTFSINNGSFSNENTFDQLAAGNYTVEVKDEEDCTVTKSIRVNSLTSLSNDIIPIINRSCAISGCHNGSISPNLTSSTSVINNASRIKSETQQRSMPRGSTLPQSEIDLIACWVEDGAKDN
ncbi:hypothetical protein [Ekhidna sp.]|uniref:hypothetical protein n=1 Tax=Ekhidna sp. TaxID=2608089 RepID=UPI003CCBC4F3